MGKTLVILGGWTRSERSYKKLVSAAPSDIKIVVIPQTYIVSQGIKNTKETINQYLKSQNINSFNLLGHSLGGAFALDYASAFPGSLDSLFLVDSEGIYGDETISQAALNFLKSHTLYAKAKAVDNILALCRTVKNPRTYAKLAKHAHQASLKEEALKIKNKTLILWGERDHITPIWQGQKLAEIIPNSKLVILKGMDHDWILHKPDLFWEQYVEFLK